MKTAHILVRDLPIVEEMTSTLKEVTDGLKDFEPLDTMIPVYQSGKRPKGKLYMLNGYEFLVKAIFGHCTDDELKTLHYNDSIVNEVLKSITSETTNYLDNSAKNVINRRLFARGKPQKISDERLEKVSKSVGYELREFKRLCKEGVIIKNLKYKNAKGKEIPVEYALADKDYDVNKDMPWYRVPEEEVEYFNEHRFFPLRYDLNNSKLGKMWTYLAFELAWLCSGDAHGGCQCPSYCYAKRMEGMYKNTRDRVLRGMNAWENHSLEEKIEFYTDVVMDDLNGIRFCDTGDVPNQKALDEIFTLVRGVSKNLKEYGIDPIGRFYIYSTRADLDWSNKPWELILNASNEELYKKVPDANWFRVVDSFDDIPEKYLDPTKLHICNCNCKCCDYCSVCRNQIIWEILG